MFRFSIFGVPVEVQPFFWITMVILGGALGAKTAADVFEIVLFVLAGFISILIHELGHALTAKAFGSFAQIELQGLGGICRHAILSRKQSFCVTFAGPVIQIILGLAAFGILVVLPETAGAPAVYFLRVLMGISLVWAILNLLPVLPLDGGQMLNAVMGPARIRITLWTSVVTAVATAALMLAFTGDFLFPIFMLLFAYQAFQALKGR